MLCIPKTPKHHPRRCPIFQPKQYHFLTSFRPWSSTLTRLFPTCCCRCRSHPRLFVWIEPPPPPLQVTFWPIWFDLVIPFFGIKSADNTRPLGCLPKFCPPPTPWKWAFGGFDLAWFPFFDGKMGSNLARANDVSGVVVLVEILPAPPPHSWTCLAKHGRRRYTVAHFAPRTERGYRGLRVHICRCWLSFVAGPPVRPSRDPASWLFL